MSNKNEQAVVDETVAEEKPVEKVSKKKKSSNGYLGDSPFGAAIYEKGRHPKDRQLADKRKAEEAAK